MCNSNRALDVPDRWRMGRSDCVRRRAATRDTDFYLNAPGEGPSQSQLGKGPPQSPRSPRALSLSLTATLRLRSFGRSFCVLVLPAGPRSRLGPATEGEKDSSLRGRMSTRETTS